MKNEKMKREEKEKYKKGRKDKINLNETE